MTCPTSLSRGTDVADVLQRLSDDMVRPAADSPAGCVLGIDVAGDRTVVAAGTASPENRTPVQRTTMFDLASVSKVVGTTTCLHRLASMGAVDIDTPVRQLIPSYRGAAATTVRELLQHRAGLWEWQPLYLAPGGAVEPFRVIDDLPLRYAPGRERHYSDLGFMTLGRVINAVTGGTLAEAVQALITSPLGLEHFQYGPVTGDVATSGADDRVEQRMVATGEPYPVFWPDDGFAWRTGPIRGTANDGNCAHAFDGVAGHAGMFATADALLDVLVALSSTHDASSLWDEAVTADFFAPGPDPEQALGWRRTQLDASSEPLVLLWHPGFTGTAVGFVPGHHIAIAFASNRLLARQPQATTELWQPVLTAVTDILTAQKWRRT